MTAKKIENNTEEDKPEAQPIRRFSRRMDDAQQGGGSTWLISFTDVMALMLTFFVLLFAMSNPKKEDWEQLTQKINESFNQFQGKAENRGAEDAVNIEKINFSQALDLDYLQAIVRKLITQSPELQSARIIDSADRLIISLPQDLLFDSGRAVLKDEASRAIFTLANTLGRIQNRIEIVGHTDPRPVSGGDYASNWELSLARAAAVGATFQNVGYKKPLTLRGQAAGRFDDMAQSIPVSERLDISRRVDVVIMEDDGRKKKLFDIGLPTLPSK